jgi:plastocyanin
MLFLSHFLFTSSLVSSTLAATFTVKVGADGTKFTPDFIRGAAGDEIIFEFYPKNHTVTQSTLAAPCSPVAGGGDTDYTPVAADATVRPTKRLVIPDATTPLWFYCKQGTHCSAGGMVFAVNPKSDEQMATYRANAVASGGAAPASTSTPAAPSATPNATPKTIPVVVGQGGLTFTPEKVTAAVGDILQLTFVGGAHTFTQSTFADPCSALAGGTDSGAKPAAGVTPSPTFNYTVTDASKPLWFYCKTGTHCKSGMVLSINAPATGNTHEAFKALAEGTGAAPSASASASSTATVDTPAPSDTSAPPTTGTAKEIAVAVGQGGLTFTPSSVTASVGDVVVLSFMSGSHTFTQSTFADPCNPLAGGADSGAVPAAGLAVAPTFNYTVTDTSKPLWFYCKTGTHCKSGMVFSINAPATGNTFDKFKATATGNTTAEVTPGSGASSAFGTSGALTLFVATALAGLML